MTEAFNVATATGLRTSDAAERLRAEGYNELPSTKPRGVLALAVDVVREPMFLLLIAGGTIYLILGDTHEALILLAFVFVIMTITFFQERKTTRALESLRELSSPRALVIRDGHPQRIPGREVVRGDLVILAEGDRVPADGVVVSCTNLTIDESLLTGESAPVRKAACAQNTTIMEAPSGEDRPFVYSGTLVVQGQGVACILATGAETELGHIGRALGTVKKERTSLQRQTGRLIGTLALIGGTLCVLVAVIYGLTREDWLTGTLVGITLAMGILPDEFAVVITVFLALGAWRMARQHVLTRQTQAVETLGAATILCVDKTGTLTMNKMRVHTLYAGGDFFRVPAQGEDSLPDNMHELVEYGILASQRDPFDPMERAFKELGERTLAKTEHLHGDWTLVREYPLSKELLAMSHVWRSPTGRDYVIAAKGAPEAIADLCHLTPAQCEELSRAVRAMADNGLRVLGVAQSLFSAETLPGQQHDFPFTLVGLVGLQDPVRPTVPAAVRECDRAGIRVVMITGDYPATAQCIAREVGLRRVDAVISGPELSRMSDEDLRERVGSTDIFARMVPEQKLRLVRALQANGEVVAMTGDGVNDAPALKAADIGIAMGERGADVAREAAALVLVNDDFSSIVAAVRMGRRVYANLNKAMAYILAIHIPIAGMTLIPVIFAWPLVLFPVHIAFLHLVIDPASSVAYEAEPADPDTMRQPPRDPHAPLFSRQALLYSLLQGGAVLFSVLTIFLIALSRGAGEVEARSLMFTTLIIANISLIVVNRSWSHSLWQTMHAPNRASWWIIAGALAVQMLVLYVPFLQNLFGFTGLHAIDLLTCLLAGIASVIWFEGLKRVQQTEGLSSRFKVQGSKLGHA